MHILIVCTLHGQGIDVYKESHVLYAQRRSKQVNCGCEQPLFTCAEHTGRETLCKHQFLDRAMCIRSRYACFTSFPRPIMGSGATMPAGALTAMTRTVRRSTPRSAARSQTGCRGSCWQS